MVRPCGRAMQRNYMWRSHVVKPGGCAIKISVKSCGRCAQYDMITDAQVRIRQCDDGKEYLDIRYDTQIV